MRPKASTSLPNVHAATVLCIEAQAPGEALLAETLRSLGHRVIACSTEQEAICRLKDAPHIIVAAHNDDTLNLHFVAQVRSTASTAHVPVLTAVRADDWVGAVARAVDAGADDCLPLPVDPRMLALRSGRCDASPPFRAG